MTDELKAQIKRMHVAGAKLPTIAEALNISVEQVRYALGVNVYTDGETTPAEINEIELRTGKRQSEIDAAALAQQRLNDNTSRRSVGEFRGRGTGPGYTTAPGGGTRADGSPAPRSLIDLAKSQQRPRRRDRGGL